VNFLFVLAPPEPDSFTADLAGHGMMRGKRAMLAVTIGGTEEAYSADGIYGPAADVLRPINHGILAFCGFDVIEPFLAFARREMTSSSAWASSMTMPTAC
jgi:putative NADPH-quinone reductase